MGPSGPCGPGIPMGPSGPGGPGGGGGGGGGGGSGGGGGGGGGGGAQHAVEHAGAHVVGHPPPHGFGLLLTLNSSCLWSASERETNVKQASAYLNRNGASKVYCFHNLETLKPKENGEEEQHTTRP